jgi:hypothetical protein
LNEVLCQLDNGVDPDLRLLHKVVELCGEHSRPVLVHAVRDDKPKVEYAEKSVGIQHQNGGRQCQLRHLGTHL